MKIESRLSLQKTGRVKQRLSQMNLKTLDAYSLKSIEKGQIVRSVQPLPPLL